MKGGKATDLTDDLQQLRQCYVPAHADESARTKHQLRTPVHPAPLRAFLTDLQPPLRPEAIRIHAVNLWVPQNRPGADLDLGSGRDAPSVRQGIAFLACLLL